MITTALPSFGQPVSSAEADVAGHLREQAAIGLYDAEVALHAAKQSHIEAWITAAYGTLHAALAAYPKAAATKDGFDADHG